MFHFPDCSLGFLRKSCFFSRRCLQNGYCLSRVREGKALLGSTPLMGDRLRASSNQHGPGFMAAISGPPMLSSFPT
jgi:hypothetical protein